MRSFIATRRMDALGLLLLGFFAVLAVLAAVPSPPAVIGVLMFFIGLLPFLYAWRKPIDNGGVFFTLFVITVVVSTIGLYLGAKYE
jgi:hypothetical protein